MWVYSSYALQNHATQERGDCQDFRQPYMRSHKETLEIKINSSWIIAEFFQDVWRVESCIHMNVCLLVALMQRMQKNSSYFKGLFHRHLLIHTSGTELEVTDMIPNCRAATALLISPMPGQSVPGQDIPQGRVWGLFLCVNVALLYHLLLLIYKWG